MVIIEDLDDQPACEMELPAFPKTHEVFDRFSTSGSLTLPDATSQIARQLASPIRNVFIRRGAANGRSAGPVKMIAIQKV